jgi:hypothetical protein
MQQAIWYHIVTVGALVLFKLCVLFVGYLIARLGHDLLIKGVSGSFQFHSQLKGATADLVSASPGLFFIFMAAVLIAVGVLKDKPFETTVTMESLQSAGERSVSEPARQQKPELPDAPPDNPESRSAIKTSDKEPKATKSDATPTRKKPSLPSDPPKEDRK